MREVNEGLVVGISRSRQCDRGRENVVRMKSRVNRQNLTEAREEEAGADEQHKCEADLCDDKHSSQPSRAAAGRATSSLVAKYRHQWYPQDVGERDQADDDGDGRRNGERG